MAFHTYSHEGILWVEFTGGKLEEVIVKHGEGGVWLAFFTLGDGTYRYSTLTYMQFN